MATANKNYNKELNVWLLVIYTTGVIGLTKKFPKEFDEKQLHKD